MTKRINVKKQKFFPSKRVDISTELEQLSSVATKALFNFKCKFQLHLLKHDCFQKQEIHPFSRSDSLLEMRG